MISVRTPFKNAVISCQTKLEGKLSSSTCHSVDLDYFEGESVRLVLFISVFPKSLYLGQEC